MEVDRGGVGQLVAWADTAELPIGAALTPDRKRAALSGLPVELLLIICRTLSTRDLKHVRLVCKRLDAGANERLFASMVMKLRLPTADYMYCDKHGWYDPSEVQPDDPYLDLSHSMCVPTRTRSMVPRLGLSLKKNPYLQNRNSLNPISEPIMRLMDGGLRRLLPLATTMKVTVVVDFSNVPINFSDSAWDSQCYAMDEFGRRFLPQILSEMTNLQTIHVHAHISHLIENAISPLLGAVCVGNQGIDVHFKITLWGAYRYAAFLRQLSDLASIDLTICDIDLPQFNKMLRKGLVWGLESVLERSPKLQLYVTVAPSYIAELFVGRWIQDPLTFRRCQSQCLKIGPREHWALRPVESELMKFIRRLTRDR